jgi:hypothetical protein
MLSNDERNKTIIEIIRGQKRTTIEISNSLEQQGKKCPDDMARTLNIMRRKGLIKGEVSTERGGWVWWVED